MISVEDALEEADGSVTKESKVGCLTTEMLDAVKRELTASQDCLQEASSSLEKMNDKHQGKRKFYSVIKTSLSCSLSHFSIASSYRAILGV